MPRLMTADFKGKELYFDLRPGGTGEPEGFWATPIFESDKKAVRQACEAKGKLEHTWMELLAKSISRWVGFVDVADNEIPCNADSIRSLCESDPGQMQLILVQIQDAARVGKLETEKN